ncbi:SLBB domain-containing protein [bacterium]|nr:SLBB domain-containing protein [bacterium]
MALSDVAREAGIVGAGGAGFPTHIKLSSQAEFLIVNGAECEPLLRVDQQILPREKSIFLRGLQAAMEAVRAKKGIVALKAKYKQAVEALKGGGPHEIFILGDFYPAGDEQILVYDVTKRIVPEGGIPLDVGCVVLNVETVINIGKAMDGQPVVDKYVTVGGAVQKPSTFKLPVGTPVRDALKLAGGPTVEEFFIVEGGPNTGKLIPSLDYPIQKTTKGILVFPKTHPLWGKFSPDLSAVLRRAVSTCCNCRECTELCPRYLLGHSMEPHLLMKVLSWRLAEEDKLTEAYLCCDCGLCENYSCPMGLSPRRIIQALKQKLSEHKIPNPHRNKPSSTRALFSAKRVPTSRLISRLGLTIYDVPAPLSDVDYQPEEVILPLKQHAGAPAKPVVKVGDKVKRGDLIAEIPEGALGARIHASIDGVISTITSQEIRIRKE